MELEFHQIARKYSNLRRSDRGIMTRLMASLATDGQLNPALVVRNQEGVCEYVLVDGYRRVTALESLGRDTVEAVELPLSESAALVYRFCQQHGRPRSAFEDGWLFRELLEVHGISQAELARRLSRSESWISRRLSLVRELPETVQEQVRKGRLCDHGAMKYLTPLARAKRSDCERLSANLSGKKVTSRQMERLYYAWKKGDAEQRQRIVEHPQLFLKTIEGLRPDPAKHTADEFQQLSKDIEILDTVSGRARRRLVGMAGSCLPKATIEQWQSAQSSIFSLVKTMEKQTDEGSRNSSGGFSSRS